MSGASTRARRLAGPRAATGAVRDLRAILRRKLAALAGEIGALQAMPEGERRPCMQRLARELDAWLRPHLRWEERIIHPIVDKYACEGPAAFSSSMRYEHEIIYRWLAELDALADGDPAAFGRRADNLLGLVLAHFELEEHVLFPVLDANLSAVVLEPRPSLPEGS